MNEEVYRDPDYKDPQYVSKNEMKTFEGIYVGKEYRRDFKTKEGKEGEVYGIRIKQNLKDQFGRSFTIYSSTKGFDTLVERKRVKLGYVIQPFTRSNGEQSTSNKVLWIGIATDQNPPQQQPQQKVQTQPQQKVQGYQLSTAMFDKFTEIYLQSIATDANMRSPARMFGLYIIKYYPETAWVKELLEKCKKALEPKK